MIQFFGYDKCSTCQKAKKYLKAKNIAFDDIDITEKPPSKSTLKAILKTDEYSLKQLFNVSGQLYRQMNMKEKMSEYSTNELIELLSQDGKLVKRPIITDGKRVTVGYKEERIKEVWG